MTEPPYRDDRLSLEAENLRLRAEVARLRGHRVRRRTAVAGVVAVLALDVAAFEFARKLLNAASDARVVGGAALVVALVVANVALALQVVPRGE